MKEKVEKWLLSLTKNERDKREFSNLRDMEEEFRSLSKDNQRYKYISIKAKYNLKKNIIFSIVVSLSLTIIFGLWNGFFSFFMDLMKLYFQGKTVNVDVAKISMVLSLGILFILLTMIVCIIVIVIRGLYKLNKELELYTEIMEEARR